MKSTLSNQNLFFFKSNSKFIYKDKEVLEYNSSDEKKCFDKAIDEMGNEKFDNEKEDMTFDDEDENLDFN